MTNSIAEFEKTGAVLVIGSNTTEAHPVISTYIKRAVRFNDCRLVVADPRRIPLVDHAEVWLRQRPGTDIALINGLINVIIQEGLADMDFVNSRTMDFRVMAETAAAYTPERVEEITGVPAGDLKAAARIYGGAAEAMIVYAMGITQHSHGTDNVKSLANLAMTCGNVGRPNTGVNPLRGQNNVQGACDMGGLPGDLTGYQKTADPAALGKFSKAWGVELSQSPGMVVTDMLPAAHEGRLKGMYIVGENPAVSDPDSNHARACLGDLEFLVVQDIFITETAQLADVILPSACFAETEGTFTNTERRVQRVRRAVDPPGEARTDWWIVQELARRMGLDWNYAGPSQVMNEIAGLTPSYAGINYRRLSRRSLQWPVADIDHPGTPCLHVDNFACGLGRFTALEHQEPKETPDEEYPLILTTGRVLYQYHTRTMTGRSEGVNDLAPECEVEVHPADAARLGLSDGQQARLSSRRGRVEARVWITDRVAEGVVFMPFHYADASANVLTNAALDPISKIPELKVCAVKLAA